MSGFWCMGWEMMDMDVSFLSRILDSMSELINERLNSNLLLKHGCKVTSEKMVLYSKQGDTQQPQKKEKLNHGLLVCKKDNKTPPNLIN